MIFDRRDVAKSHELFKMRRILHGDVLFAKESLSEVERHVPGAQLARPLHQLHGADENCLGECSIQFLDKANIEYSIANRIIII